MHGVPVVGRGQVGGCGPGRGEAQAVSQGPCALPGGLLCNLQGALGVSAVAG